MRLSGRQERTGECRDNERGHRSYGDRRAVRLQLGGSQIHTKLVGMEMTDNVHWADVFGPNGSLRSYSMGRKEDGKWWIKRMSCASIAARMTEAATKSGCPGRVW